MVTACWTELWECFALRVNLKCESCQSHERQRQRALNQTTRQQPLADRGSTRDAKGWFLFSKSTIQSKMGGGMEQGQCIAMSWRIIRSYMPLDTDFEAQCPCCQTDYIQAKAGLALSPFANMSRLCFPLVWDSSSSQQDQLQARMSRQAAVAIPQTANGPILFPASQSPCYVTARRPLLN